MSSYLIGNLIGRFLASAFLVWLVLLCINKFKLGQSTKKLIRPLPLLATILLFVLGLMSHAAAETNKKQLFWITNFSDLGVKEIFVPAEPEWTFDVFESNEVKSIQLASQANNDIAAAVELSQHGFQVSKQDSDSVRNAIIKQLNNELQSELTKTNTDKNHLNSTRYQAKTKHSNLQLHHQIDIFHANDKVWTFSTVVSDASYQKFQTVRTKIFNSILLVDSTETQSTTDTTYGYDS